MATDLEARALDKRDLLKARRDDVRSRLADAQALQLKRHAAPDTVARSDWAGELGTNQHVEVAGRALAAARDEEQALRSRIATGGRPADAGALAPELQEAIVTQAELRVELRYALERRAHTDALVRRTNALLESANAELREAEARLAWAEAQKKRTDDLREATATEPLDTLGDAATAVLDGQAFDDANDRLDELLPGELRTRASERFDDAASVLNEARSHRANGIGSLAALAEEARRFDAPVAAAEATYTAAREALAAYVASAAAVVAGAEAKLEAVASHPDLTDAQHAALHDDAPPESGDALAAEGELTAALVAARALQREVDDAITAALAQDPDADPEANDDVVAARAALDEAAIQDPIAAARSDYDARAASNLEAEVPVSLWSALGNFLEVRTALERLGNDDTVAQLLDDLGGAEDVLAEALDARDDAFRKALMVGLHIADREAAAEAAAETQTDRTVHYLRGEGPAGRTPVEL